MKYIGVWSLERRVYRTVFSVQYSVFVLFYRMFRNMFTTVVQIGIEDMTSFDS